MRKPLSLYIHIPFCSKRCDYCHFYVVTSLEELIPAYVTKLVAEITATATKLEDYQVETIYIGGGTPSLLSPQQLQTILSTIHEQLQVVQNPEITLETNPEDINVAKLKAFRQAGVTRLSVGLQAAQNHLLSQMGRTYTREEFAAIAAEIQATGFTNYNFDLLFGLPNQTLADWEDSLNFALSFNPTHLSCYSLELDHQSVFGQKYRKGLLIPPSDEENRRFYSLAKTKLSATGYMHYELSNWAKPGFECHHNLNFWHNQPYYGFGAGAHSFFENKTWSNIPIVKKYLLQNEKADNRVDLSTVNELELDQQGLILNLRLIKGVLAEKIPPQLQKTVTDLVNEKLLQFDGVYFSLTQLGKNTFDEVARRIFVS